MFSEWWIPAWCVALNKFPVRSLLCWFILRDEPSCFTPFSGDALTFNLFKCSPLEVISPSVSQCDTPKDCSHHLTFTFTHIFIYLFKHELDFWIKHGGRGPVENLHDNVIKNIRKKTCSRRIKWSEAVDWSVAPALIMTSSRWFAPLQSGHIKPNSCVLKEELINILNAVCIWRLYYTNQTQFCIHVKFILLAYMKFKHDFSSSVIF